VDRRPPELDALQERHFAEVLACDLQHFVGQREFEELGRILVTVRPGDSGELTFAFRPLAVAAVVQDLLRKLHGRPDCGNGTEREHCKAGTLRYQPVEFLLARHGHGQLTAPRLIVLDAQSLGRAADALYCAFEGWPSWNGGCKHLKFLI